MWYPDTYSRLTTIDMGRKLEAVPLFRGGEELGPHLIQCRIWAEAYLSTKWHLDPSSRVATMDMGQNWGLCPLLGEGELSLHPTQCFLGRCLLSYQVFIHAAIWQQDMCRKLRALPLWGEGAASPSNTVQAFVHSHTLYGIEVVQSVIASQN